LWSIEAWRSLPPAISATLPISVVLFVASIGAFMALFLWLLLALAVLDAEHLWLPNWLTWPGIAIGVVWKYASAILAIDINKATEVPIYSEFVRFIGGPVIMQFEPLLAPLAAAFLVLFIRLIYWLIRRREGLGLGDAKLMALLAAWLGFSGALIAFGIGVLIGALVALVVLLRPRKQSGDERWAQMKLPLGTFLCIGGIVSVLWGQWIIAAYMRWAGF